ncbi:MAG: hypothetical protein A2X86_14715 [Bdellovibrionales bacterium GWA2_49_15]|nr:MAG: hypothetical protein A2X86_14715 [Bdellovibrionales bacterium GWA2_49_15]HAZ13407.1 esterase [Bdellovibrionales bacterium]
MTNSTSIWHNDIDLKQLNSFNQHTMIEHLGIEITERGEDFLTGTMPVDQRTQRPFGVLHGGALCSLAETLGSIAGNMTIDFKKEIAVGMNLSANYLRPVTEGVVTGTATLIHKGKRTQLWDVSIINELKQIVCCARLLLSVLPKN